MITNLLMVIVSLKRLGEFFDATDQGIDSISTTTHSEIQKSKPSIEFKNCTFSWSQNFFAKSESNFLLSNISISITDPKLCVIIGEIAAGKTSFLSAILGQMNFLNEDTKKSHFEINGSLAYVTQEAFILNGTVKENILFYRKYDSIWYQKVVEACALERDIRHFSGIKVYFLYVSF